MRLVRFGAPGEEKPGLIDDEHVLRDLSHEIDDIAGSVLSRDGLAHLASIDPKSLPKADPSHRLGPPVGRIGHFLGIGRNYEEHAKETGAETPTEPLVFSKAPSAIGGPHDDIIMPKDATKLDYEAEIAIVIGEEALYVSEAEAMDHVAGFCLCNDVTERTFQKDRGGQFIKGKSSPGFGPLGPWLVTKDRIENPQAFDIWLNVNGEPRQKGTSADMIFSFATIVSHISHFMKLMPGDVITTGTPAGVGAGMTPPRFLKIGDIVTLGASGLGEQRLVVVERGA